ncbi:MAG: hypothetical protein RLZZ297_181 [Chloroflexota bacterium]|jgi:ABC-type transport system involved in multi-copper enzyme maturation permease subunit
MNELNPVLLRELRGRLRTARSYWLLCGALLLVATIAILIYSADYASNNGQGAFNGSDGQSVFLALVVTALVSVTVIAPLMAASSIAGERERQTFDLVVLTQLRPAQIVFGKIAATMAYCLLFVTALTPLMAMTFLIGGVDVGELVIHYILIMSAALFFTCIGVYWSACTQTAITATGYAVATIVAILLVLPVFVFVVPLLFSAVFGENPATWYHTILAVHPYAAILFTQERISMGNVWSEPYSVMGFAFTGPAMWILTVAVQWFWSCVCVVLCIARLSRASRGGAS